MVAALSVAQRGKQMPQQQQAAYNAPAAAAMRGSAQRQQLQR